MLERMNDYHILMKGSATWSYFQSSLSPSGTRTENQTRCFLNTGKLLSHPTVTLVIEC